MPILHYSRYKLMFYKKTILKNSYIKPIHYWNERNLIAAVLVDAAAIS